MVLLLGIQNPKVTNGFGFIGWLLFIHWAFDNFAKLNYLRKFKSNHCD